MDSKDPRNGVPMGTFKQGGESDPKSAQKSDPAAADTSPDLFGGRPGRKRVRTLLGVPLAEALGGQPPRPEQRNEDISQAIQSVLNEEDVAIPVEIEDIDGEISLVADAELAEYFDPPAAKSAPALPLLIPSQYADAQARDQKDAVSDTAKQPALSVAGDRDSETSIDTRKQPVLIRAEDRDSEAVIETTKRPALAAAATSAPLPAAASTTQSPAASTPPAASLPPPAAISSLMPREVRRPQLAPAESTPRGGLLMVAAMLLIAGGGWWLTSGSFSRTADSTPHLESAAPQAVAQPPAAPQEAVQAPAMQPPAPVAAPEQPAVATQSEPQKSVPAPALGTHDKAVAGVVRSGKAKSVAGKAKQPGAGGDIPEQPSRAVVVQRLEAVRSSVQACAAGRSGVADLDITVANSGAVTHVLVGGDFAGTTQGSCIARAVREARFPSFKQERLRLLFPYVI